MNIIRRFWLPFLGLSACVTLMACHLRWADEPWDDSLAGFVSAAHYGRTFRVWDAHGAAHCGFVPTLLASESFMEPYHRYLNHPPTPYLIAYPAWKYLGRSEAAARTPTLILLAFSAWALFRVIRFAAGPREAWTTLALYGSLPILFAHGNTVDAPAYSLAFIAPAVWTWLRWRSGAGGYWPYFVFATLGGLMDWFGYFVVPALWLDLALSRTRVRPALRAGFLAGLPFGITMLVILSWIVVSARAPFELRDVLGFLLQTLDPAHNWQDQPMSFYFVGLLDLTLRGLGAIHATVVVAGLILLVLAAFRERISTHMRAAIALFLAGILPSLVFFERANDHEFWSMVGAPGFAAIAAWTITWLRPRSPEWIAPTILLATTVLGTVGGVELHDSYRSTVGRDRAAVVNEYIEPGDVLLHPGEMSVDSYYLDTMSIPRVWDRDQYDIAIDWLSHADSEWGRLFLLWPSETKKSYDWIGQLPLENVTVLELNGIEAMLFELDRTRVFAESG